MDSKDFQKRFEEAYKLLSQETTSREKFESVRTLIKGFNPKLDEALGKVSSALSDVEKLQKGEIIELSAEHLPENSEEEKKRKKAILFLIKNYKDLRSEIEKAKNELEKTEGKGNADKFQSVSKLLISPKGAFGLITIVAIIIASVLILTNNKSAEPFSEPTQKESSKIQVIDVDGKKVPLTELKTGIGPECQKAGKDSKHYHALNHEAAIALDGTTVVDPGGCGFGKVDEVKIEEVEQ